MTADAGDRWLRPEDLAPDGPVTVEQWLGAPALSYPRRPATVLDALDRAVLLHGDRVAVVDTLDSTPGARTTWRQLAERVSGTARRWQRWGIGPGDAVAVAAANSSDFLVAVLAAAHLRARTVGLPAGQAPARWAYLVAHSRARLVLHDEAQTPLIADALKRLPDAWDEVAGTPAGQTADGHGRAAFEPDVRMLAGSTEARSPWQLPPAMPDESDCYQVVYTSGTTGRPKASRVVHRASIHSGMSYQRVLQLQSGEATAVAFSLGYISAMHAHVLPAMLAGGTLVMTAAGRPRSYLRTLAEHRVAWAYSVPSWWSLVVRDRDFRATDLSALRLLGSGGAPFPVDTQLALRAALPGVQLLDIYGLSETHSPATILRDAEFATRPGSTGRPLPCMEVSIRDETGREVPPGEVGEVWLRGSLVTTGYEGDDTATRDAIRDGWFRSGDVGRVDAEGFLFVVDRVKDMINTGGEKVFSAEVEAVLRRHPRIADAAVVAGPDRLGGEAVVAFVVAVGAAPELSEVRRWVRSELGERAAPVAVHVLPDLPRNGVGKTDKLRLRELLRSWAVER